MMKGITANQNNFENSDSPFTELFSVLKRCSDSSSIELSGLAYNSDELMVMHQHIDNAMFILLQGLQELGRILSLDIYRKSELKHEINSLGFLISGISNLTEALNVLKLDTNYTLKHRGLVNF